MHNRISAPHAVPDVRNATNACYETTTRRTPNTLHGCWAVGVPAHLYLAGTRPHAERPFSPSLFLCSLLSPNAERRTPGGCSCCSSWLQHHWLVQHTLHTIENRNQNSFRATRHAPNATQDITDCLYALWGYSLTQPYERAIQAASSTLRNIALVSIGQYDSTFRHQNVRSIITMRLRGICSLDTHEHTHNSITDTLYTSEGTSKLIKRRWGNRHTERAAVLRWVVSEAYRYHAPCSEAVERSGAFTRKSTLEAERRTPNEASCIILGWAFVSARSAYSVVSRPTSGTGAASVLVPASLSRRSTSPMIEPSYPLNARTLERSLSCVGGVLDGAKQLTGTVISTEPLPFVLVLAAACVLVVDQPHTTKSLTGGVQNPLLLSFSTDSSIVHFIRGDV